MDNLNPSKKTVDLIARNPLAWVTAFVALIAAFFIGQNTFNNKEASTDCRQDVAEAKAETKQVRDQMVQILLADKERQERDRQKNDSILRAKLTQTDNSKIVKP